MSFSTFLPNHARKLLAAAWAVLLISLLAVAPRPVLAQVSPIQLTKTIEGNPATVNTGDVLQYRVTFECSNLTGPCGALELTDVLNPGLTYLPPPQSAVPGGFTITEGPAGTITITKDDNNFLDGTQFDAVIAVRVNYDLRPLPQVINNQISGRVDPPDPGGFLSPVTADAPPVTVNPATEQWEVTKTLYRPAVNPTVDTDVTYRVSLCPTSPTGNVSLTNVVLTDNLPAGAVFVSASNGGVQGPPGTVSWNVGNVPLNPVTAATCIDRFVTMRFPTPTFTAGVSTVTNNAGANASYIDNTGGTVGPVSLDTTPLTHPIDNAVAVPTYSKDDTGDPVGINGTGRFVLNLSTAPNNVPVLDPILIDNMPPELQVTQIYGGAWDVAFNTVTAIIEYSTNNGGTWLPLGTTDYDDNLLFAAPSNFITNVRWRFFDNGNPELPYTFGFTSQPQIRFTPRIVAAPGFPAATAGSTYNNCLQVSRTDPTTGATTDPCNIEPMTIEQNEVQLQISKAETPGTAWDDLYDPTITTFTPDTSILPGDTVRYVITVDMTERSAISLFEPTVRDILPAAELVYVRTGNIQLDGVAVGTAPNFTQVGQNLTWSWAGTGFTMPYIPNALQSHILTIEFFAYVPRNQVSGTFSNDLRVVSNSAATECENGTALTDTTDIDGDANTAETICVNPDSFIVERSAALRGQKWIRSTDAANAQIVNSTTFAPDPTCPTGGTTGLPGSANTFTRFPCISQAYPEGALASGSFTPPAGPATLDDFEYSVRIFNDGNVAMNTYVLYDILPFFGDNGSGGTLAATARNSEFQPALRAAVQFISGPAPLGAANFAIEYNPSNNPCRPEVFNQPTGSLVPGGCNNAWTPTFSTTARAFRIRLVAGTIPASATVLNFGAPMNIPADVPTLGVLNPNDPQSLEIAWNSFSHVGSYLDLAAATRFLLASEPRKVGITIPERLSIGNRVWRDADNSGTINAPDDTTPGIPGVTVFLYQDYDNNGIPDGAPIATDVTDANGFYLFSNLVPDGTNRYVVGIPASNFVLGQPLYNLRSSTGPQPAQAFANPPYNTTDSNDNGIDPAVAGNEVFSQSISLLRNTSPAGETDLSAQPPAFPDGAFSRGFNGEADTDSNLTIDFGFFSQVDLFSIGNRVWLDNGAGGPAANINNGIMDGTEAGIPGVRVEIYRDGNGNNAPDPAEFVRFDTTDAGGYYLFDQLDPGTYFIVLPASNFTVGTGALQGLHSSTPTGTELGSVPGNPLPIPDRDDNGINQLAPATTGIRSGPVVLVLNTAETVGETDISGQADPGVATHFNNDPTAWDGPGSIGRYNEDDDNSNITIDFGFSPPLSIGNRVWLDNGSTAGGPDTDNFNDGIQNGNEPGIAGVTLTLFRDNNGDSDFNDPGENIRTTTTDANGYYLFDGLETGLYVVRVDAANFGAALTGLESSTGNTADITTDVNDNGIDDVLFATNGIFGNTITLAYGANPTQTPGGETDIPAPGAAYGTNSRGRFGEGDTDSNLTMDFGFMNPPFNLGNRVWFDDGLPTGTANDGLINGTEPGAAGVTVNLLDGAGNPVNNPNIAGFQAYTVTTDANGYYRFDGLPAGNYIVEIPASNFTTGNPLFGYVSSVPTEADPNNNVDSNDNGIDVVPGNAVRSGVVVLGPGAIEPTAPAVETDIPGAGPFAGQGPGPDNRANMTVDFGFVTRYSLGNRVWFDDGSGGGGVNDGLINGTEAGIPGVLVRLLDTAGNPVDGDPIAAGVQPYTATTDANGYYRFDTIPTGNYIVEIAASNFTVGNPLFGFGTSTPTETDPNGNVDSNDNGLNLPVAGAIRSGTVTLGPGNIEPIGETDLSATGQGPNPDARANMTVDFGFFPLYSIGNRVWADLDNSGTINGADGGTPGIALVQVQLLKGGVPFDLDVNTAGVQSTVITDANGYYRFDNLPAGNDYVVQLIAANFAPGGVLEAGISSTGAGQNADPNSDIDNDDNGLDTFVVGALVSNPITVGPAQSEPLAPGVETDVPGAGAYAGQGNTVDGRSNLTIDFGIVPRFSLGNLVWIDDGIGVGGVSNDGIRNGTEAGVDGVQLQLYTGAGVAYDANPATPAIDPYIVTTANGGHYRFDGLPAGDYIVEVLVGSFGAGQPLNTFTSSRGAEANPNADVDNNDNGIDNAVTAPAAAVRSGTVTLGPGYNEPLAPAVETDVPAAGAFSGQGAVDAWANMTVDFGFVRLFNLGNRVFRDDGTGGGVFNNGLQDGSESGINGVTVRLLDGLGNPADNPNIPGTQDYVVTTSPQGYYRFDNLPAGDYIVEIVATNFTGGGTLANFFSSTGASQEANPNNNVDRNDNGLDVPVAGGIRSGVVTLGGPANEPVGEADLAPTGQGGPDAQANMTVDFGFVPGSYSVGNRVWIDTDNSGDINGGEAGVNGVTVRLLDNLGALITTQVTANGGYYRFDGLAAGQYVVEIAASNFGAGQPLFGLASSTGALQNANPNSDIDSDDNGLDVAIAGAIRSGTVTLGPGDSEPTTEVDLSPSGQGATNPRANMTVDFGFNTPPVVFSLGNRVWFDADNDGTINPFDGPTPGINGVTVNLLNTGGVVIATTTTAGGGYYRFDNLPAGDYVVEIAASNFVGAGVLLNQVSSSGPLQEANPNSDVDRNDNGLDLPVAGAIRSGTVTLGPTAVEPVGETDVSGVAAVVPDNQENLTVDFGFTNPTNVYSLGNRVWRDNGAAASGNNGRMDAGEPGIAGVVVNLLDSTGTTIVSTVTTDANGYYRFDNLPAGDYRVEIAAANFAGAGALVGTTSSTGAFQEANPNADVDRNDNGIDLPVAGAIRSGIVTLGPGNSEPLAPGVETDVPTTGPFAGQGAPDNHANMTVDFGFVDSFSLGNRVWRDDGTGGGTPANGIQDGTEPGVDGVTVRLLDSTGTTVLATTTTAGGGYYRFDNLVPGTYIVEIASTNFAVGNPLNGLISSPVTATDPNSDIDLDDNGLDVAVAGAIRSGPVVLGPTANEPVGETDLSASGQGTVDNRANMTVDFGFSPPTNTYSLGNRVWLDDGAGGGVANDGIHQPGEIGEVGVTVNLIASNGTTVIATQVTDGGGYYRFDNLAAGDYFVEIAASNFAVGSPLNGLLSSTGAEANPNLDVDRNDNGIDTAPGSAVRSGLVTLGPGNSEPVGETDVSGVAPLAADDHENLTVDFGFAPPTTTYSIGNRVWQDDDNSGTLNGAEVGIANVTVRLLDSTGTTVLNTVTTDAGGYYRFDNLAAGNYIVEIASTNFTAGQPLNGLASSNGAGQNANPNSDIESDDNGIDTFVAGAIRSGTVTLGGATPEPTAPAVETDVPGAGPFAGQGSADNQSNLTIDFGFTASYSLGNRVWFDTNNNALLDGGELGIAGVRVELYRDTDGNGAYTPGTDTLINNVNTDGTGYYLFTGLAAANYVVVIPGSNFTTGRPLFGYYSSLTTRNNATGALQETAPTDPDDDIDSDDNGFTSGTLGTAAAYVASQALTIGPGNVEPTTETDPTSATFPDTTANNRSNLTVDFGFYTMTLGNLVWFDSDNSGTVNGAEAGLNGVTVQLYAVGSPLAGPPLATTVTTVGGLYTFPNLAAGDYIVRIPASNFTGVLSGFTSSTGGAGNPFETPPGVPPTNGVDSDDNGVHETGPASAIVSSPMSLIPGALGNTTDNVTGRTTNNTVDFGLISSAPLIFSLGNRVFMDFNNSGVQDTGEPGIAGVQMRLLDTSNNPIDDPNQAGVQDYLVTTDASGYYRFDNLPAGDYIVQILEVNFLAGGTLETMLSSTPDELLPNNDVDRNDNGIGTTFIPGLGIVSGVVTLGPAEPLGETDIGTGGQGGADIRANMTVDFGFTPPVDLIITKDDGFNAIIVGAPTTYTITIFNNTAAPFANVVFTDNVPTDPPFTPAGGFVPASINWTCSSTPGGLCPTASGTTAAINETIVSIPAGARLVYSVTGRVPPCSAACGPTITNTGTLSTGQSDTDVDAVIFDPPRGTKTGRVLDNTHIRWEMVWVSTAPAGTGQAVVVTDTIQAGQTFSGNLTCTVPAGSTTTTTSCTISGNTITWSGNLFGTPANQVTIGFDVTVSGNGTYNNDALLTEPGTNIRVNAAATVEITGGGGGTPAPAATGLPSGLPPIITVTPNPPFGAPGTPVDWTVHVNNPNGTPIDNAVITIPVPPELIIIGVDAPPGAVVTINGNTITIFIPSLPPGDYPDIIIHTRIIKGIKVPFDIVLTATLNACSCSASGHVQSISSLPATGEAHDFPFAGVLVVVVIGAAGVVMVRRRTLKASGY